MNIEQWPLDRIIPYVRNPRKGQAVTAVKASIKEFGFRQPIVVDRDGVIVVGHTRYLAAQELRLKTVPVHVATELTPIQIKAYRLADNRTAQNATWDEELLKLELLELQESEFDLELTAFTKNNIDQILADSINQDDLWQGMPEFNQEDQLGVQKITVHFKTRDDVVEFTKLIGQPITEKTNNIWFPDREIVKNKDFGYVADAT